MAVKSFETRVYRNRRLIPGVITFGFDKHALEVWPNFKHAKRGRGMSFILRCGQGQTLFTVNDKYLTIRISMRTKSLIIILGSSRNKINSTFLGLLFM